MKKTRKNINRISPTESATDFEEGTIKRGNDRHQWVVKKSLNGVPRWTPFLTTKLFGLQPLTVDILAKHIGKEVKIYHREYGSMFPRVTDKNLYTLTFISSGDAKYLKRKAVFPNWLKTRQPAIDFKKSFSILGKIQYKKDEDFEDSALSAGPNLVSLNFMNTECFIQVQGR